MKKYLFTTILFVFFISNLVCGKSLTKIDSKEGNSPDSLVFQTYLDSIEKYVYMDSRKILEYVTLCEEMITEDKSLSNTNRLNFVIQNIYYQYTLDSLLEISRLIETNRKMLELSGIPNSIKKNFQYLDGFTSKVLGDQESAQKIFYQLLEDAIENNDTSTIYRSLHFLGTIYLDQKDYEKAEEYLLRSYELAKVLRKTVSTKIHPILDLVDLYIEKGELENASYFNEIGLQMSDSLNLLDFKFDFMLNKVIILEKKNEISLAKNAYDKCLAHATLMNNSYYLRGCKEILASILFTQGLGAESLKVYKELIEEEENGQRILPTLLGYYDSAHKVAHENKNFEEAYDFLFKHNAIRDSLAIEEQFQQTAYLKIKFEADQKEKENVILTAQVLQKKSQNQLLYVMAVGFLLFIFLLSGNVIQKRKYNRQLRNDVKDRTLELEQSNKRLHESIEELSQLNNILSHDLKEPLRSIVGFTALAKKEIKGNIRLEEYLHYINKGGRQLNQLIEDVNQFQVIGNEERNIYSYVDINVVRGRVVESIQPLLLEKKAKVIFSNLPTIYSNESLLYIVFKNLIENGIKYNQSDIPTININYKKKDNKHCFLFQDNGIGIPEEYHRQIFEMFKRLNSRKDYEGSGLGLNIVKKIIGKVGGDIAVLFSEEDKGSLFEVNFPIVEDNETHFFQYDNSSSN